MTLSGVGGRIELARQPIPADHVTPGSGTFADYFVMSCEGVADAPKRAVFGHLQPPSALTYTGPAAAGQSAGDGLFLFALTTDDTEPTVITLQGDGPLPPTLTISVDSFATASSSGSIQASGCRVL